MQRTGEQFVETPVPQVNEQIVEIPTLHGERILETPAPQGNEQILETPVPHVNGPIVESLALLHSVAASTSHPPAIAAVATEAVRRVAAPLKSMPAASGSSMRLYSVISVRVEPIMSGMSLETSGALFQKGC